MTQENTTLSRQKAPRTRAAVAMQLVLPDRSLEQIGPGTKFWGKVFVLLIADGRRDMQSLLQRQLLQAV